MFLFNNLFDLTWFGLNGDNPHFSKPFCKILFVIVLYASIIE